MISVGIFAKPPRPGLVKTRLIPDIGADRAAAVYRYCLEYTLEMVRASGFDYRLHLSEACDDELLQDENYSVQKGNDLGTRMFNAIREQLSTRTDGTIIVGSDCLDIEPRHLLQAARDLADRELVLLPALDGGFALIGCTTIDPRLFHDVNWSTAQVLEQTLANADNLGYRTSLLETVRDIDTLHDLEQYPELLTLIASS